MNYYSIADLQTLFSATTFALGRELADNDRVKSLDLRGNLITAIVHSGALSKPYRVYVRKEDKLQTECSCGASPACEHIAAALLAALNRHNSQPALKSSVRTESGETAQKAAFSVSRDEQQLLYIIHPDAIINTGLAVRTCVARKLPNGTFSNGNPYSAKKANKNHPARFFQGQDLDILLALAPLQNRDDESVILGGLNSGQLLQAIIRTGRCHLRDTHSPPIQMGSPRPLTLTWKVDKSGTQHLHWQVTPAADSLLVLSTVYCLDEGRQQCSEIQTGLPSQLLTELLARPSLSPQQAIQLNSQIATTFPHVSLPQLRNLEVARTVRSRPVACLRLLSRSEKSPAGEPRTVQYAALYFDYDGLHVTLDSQNTYFDGESLVEIHRDRAFEQQSQQRLLDSGFRAARKDDSDPRDWYQLSLDPDAWLDFQYDVIPELVKDHWQVDYDPGFELRAARHTGWFCDTRRDKEKDWFDFTLGVTIDGERINLLPVLLQFIKQYSPQAPLDLSARHYSLQIQDKQWIRIPAKRLRSIFDTLMSLYAAKSVKISRHLRLPIYQLAKLGDFILDDASPVSDWTGDQDLKVLANNLRSVLQPPEVAVPQSLNARLRPYQQNGLNWLQFLREQNLAGILADDMGLGKTVQTLANLLVEKQQGRMFVPSLIIAPTSLVFNWRNEIRRLSPSLSVLCLHGTKRHQHFPTINAHDLIITSYPLLIRDEEVLLAYRYHYLILDEAHYIKNPKTKAARCVRNINAEHKLCLTGTPLENHLGELWSLFDFLLPGYLGNQAQFQTLFRTPVEKQGDTERAEALSRRVRPFMLRRTKDAVARELPEKTEIVHTIPLTQTQQDLYETVRLSVHGNVRGAIERDGLARSQITILDALLKLRQVCCDPRLVTRDNPRQDIDSSKLLLLREMIPEMIEEGRRILLFSQFTSMLALIESEMQQLGIDYAKLTGQTIDRAAQVECFQSRQKPLFLISLKAGGVGLNLTAADTVIHYDPWWNPAVEQQATDRAHRIGQTQPVFVYKLICEGTVEEKILALQQNKKGLADSIFQAQNSPLQRLSEADIDQLLAPLE